MGSVADRSTGCTRGGTYGDILENWLYGGRWSYGSIYIFLRMSPAVAMTTLVTPNVIIRPTIPQENFIVEDVHEARLLRHVDYCTASYDVVDLQFHPVAGEPHAINIVAIDFNVPAGIDRMIELRRRLVVCRAYSLAPDGVERSQGRLRARRRAAQ